MSAPRAAEIHCHKCGGFMSGDPMNIAYRLRLTRERPAVPHSGLCRCTPPVVFGPPPGYRSIPAMPAVAPPSGGD